jgi:hypothetical protein
MLMMALLLPTARSSAGSIVTAYSRDEVASIGLKPGNAGNIVVKGTSSLAADYAGTLPNDLITRIPDPDPAVGTKRGNSSALRTESDTQQFSFAIKGDELLPGYGIPHFNGSVIAG